MVDRISLAILIVVLAGILLVVGSALAHAAGWAYVWGWGPTKCGALGGTSQWVWDSVIKQPNWLCKYPRPLI